MKKAENLTEILQAIQPEPLSGDDLQKFYVDCNEARGYDSIRQIAMILTQVPNQKILLCSHRGSGKSTELNRLINLPAIEQKFIPIKFSAQQELDLNSLTYIDLLFEIVYRMVSAAKEKQMEIDPSLTQRIYQWADVKEVVVSKKESTAITAEAEAQAGTNLLSLLKLMFRIKGEFKSATENRETIRRVYRQRLTDFFDQCNLLINAIELASGQKLLIVIDDLDKMDLVSSKELFFERGSQITRLNCHTLFTFPISLYYSPELTAIKGSFQQIEPLPMIKLNEQNGEPYHLGRDVLQSMLEERIDKALFEQDAMGELIAKSGGSMRDLFHILQQAALHAQLQNMGKITSKSVRWGVGMVKNEMTAALAEKKYRDGNGVEWHFTPSQYIALLKQIDGGDKQPEPTADLMELLHSRCVLQYNGDRWYDVHPLIKDIIRKDIIREK